MYNTAEPSFTSFNSSFNFLHLANVSLEIKMFFALFHPTVCLLAFITCPSYMHNHYKNTQTFHFIITFTSSALEGVHRRQSLYYFPTSDITCDCIAPIPMQCPFNNRLQYYEFNYYYNKLTVHYLNTRCS